MSVYKTEEEQVDDLKRWIKAYVPAIVIGVLVAVTALYGWRYWQGYQHTQAMQASALYQQAVEAYQTQRSDILQHCVENLQKKYTRSPYTAYALFLQAKAAVERQDFIAAEHAFDWIIQHNHDSNIHDIAILRLASVQTMNHHARAAIELLKEIHRPAFQGLALVKIADAYLALNDVPRAAANYQAANQLLPNADNTLPTLAIKMANINAT